jgi:cytoskeletal protein CcmA (bactofilin family)
MWKSDQSVTPPRADRDPSARAVSAESRSAEKAVVDLGSSVAIEGELSASEDLILHAQMEGRISLPDHTLTVGPDAHIKAEISRRPWSSWGGSPGM